MLDFPASLCMQARLLALAGAVVLASRGTTLLSRHATAFVYVLAYGTWTGANLWTTFIAGARAVFALWCRARAGSEEHHNSCRSPNCRIS